MQAKERSRDKVENGGGSPVGTGAVVDHLEHHVVTKGQKECPCHYAQRS